MEEAIGLLLRKFVAKKGLSFVEGKHFNFIQNFRGGLRCLNGSYRTVWRTVLSTTFLE